ncbi:hypothetical protein D3C72_1801750 [compost metagenome]
MGQHFTQRMLVVAGTPGHQRQDIRPQHGGAIKHSFDGLELVAGHLTLGRVIYHQTDQGLGTERDLYPATGGRQGQRGEIVEVPAQRHRDSDTNQIKRLR